MPRLSSYPVRPLTHVLGHDDDDAVGRAALGAVSIVGYGAVGDGVTDCSADIQDAIDSGEAVIFVPEGIFGLSEQVVIGSQTRRFYGPGTLKALSGNTTGVLAVSGGVNCVVDGLTIDGDDISNLTGLTIQVSSVNCVGQNLEIKNCDSAGAFVLDSTNCGIRDCYVHDVGAEGTGIVLWPGTHSFAERNYIEVSAAWFGIQMAGGNGHYCANNLIIGAQTFGIVLAEFNSDSESNFITGNDVRDTVREAIVIIAENGNSINNTVIEGNTCTWPNVPSTDFGISVYTEDSGGSINDCAIRGNIIDTSKEAGITISDFGGSGTMNRIHVHGNTIINPGTGTVAGLNPDFPGGISLDGGATNCLVDGNYLWANNSKMTYGVSEGSSHGTPSTNVFRNNTVVGFVTAKAKKAVSSTTVDEWISYTPAVTSGSGTITTASATGRYRHLSPGTIEFAAEALITTNGTGATAVNVSLPYNSPNDGVFQASVTGRASGISGKTLAGTIAANAGIAVVQNYDGTYPGASGEFLVIGGTYRSVI